MQRSNWQRAGVAACAALALVLGLSEPAHAAAHPGVHAAKPAAAQQYFWKSSDGSQKTSRLFREKTYKTQAKLPHLVVTVVPATPAHAVYLQFQQKGKWITENKVTTDDTGVANIDLNPFCSNDTWCDGTWQYRLHVGKQNQNLKIAYSEK